MTPFPLGPVRRPLALSLVTGISLALSAALSSAQPPAALRPPRGEINPTFLEQHGWLIAAMALVALIAIVLLIVLFTRPKLRVAEPPEVAARRALHALGHTAEDGTLIMEASRIFRRYVLFAFGFPAVELTTKELREALQSRPQCDPAMVTEIDDFLRQCDEEKFAPLSRPPRLRSVARALELLEKIEVQRRRQAAIKGTSA